MRLHDYLEFFAKEKPDHPYAEMDGTTMTYAEADRRANCICNGMLESGLAKGDRFSYLSKNSIDMAIMYFAASKAGTNFRNIGPACEAARRLRFAIFLSRPDWSVDSTRCTREFPA